MVNVPSPIGRPVIWGNLVWFFKWYTCSVVLSETYLHTKRKDLGSRILRLIISPTEVIKAPADLRIVATVAIESEQIDRVGVDAG